MSRKLEVLKFITDMETETCATDVASGITTTIPRYAVWGDKGRGKPEVIETGDDLVRMQRKHNVPDERVCKLVSKP